LDPKNNNSQGLLGNNTTLLVQNCTLPVGVVAAEAAGVTVMVKVTSEPCQASYWA
jgi:hypothetical protein